mmetsp:Transcript_35308/g.34315  ORF Transcript_35308/g.34315 Transcript_35308/m.34315 type:complete len:200 (-) Transcript_35308:37-636(-)
MYYTHDLFRVIRDSSSWPWYFYLIIANIAFLLGLMVVYQFYKYYLASPWVFWFYIILAGSIFISQLIPSLILYNDADYHFHHYFLGFLLAIMFGYPDVLSTIGHGLGCAFLTEAASTYGFDTHWDYYDPFVLSLQDRFTYYFRRQDFDQDSFYIDGVITEYAIDIQTWQATYDQFAPDWQKQIFQAIIDWTTTPDNYIY